MIPTEMVKSGVSAFNIPASVLVTLVSAIQNKKAGKKLPSKPETKINPRLSLGICLKALNAKGNNTAPALIIRKQAT